MKIWCAGGMALSPAHKAGASAVTGLPRSHQAGAPAVKGYLRHVSASVRLCADNDQNWCTDDERFPISVLSQAIDEITI
jgi:hypothetical protein